MSEFVNDWVRCNTCFKSFDDSGGLLTSCGHFFCNRSECHLTINEGRTKCPICKTSCGSISLTDTLPPDILQFFEEPESVIQKSIDILRFHNNQKELIRKHFSENKDIIKELEQKVSDLQKENQKLSAKLEKLKSSKSARQSDKKKKKEVIIPGIADAKRNAPKDFFQIPQTHTSDAPLSPRTAPLKHDKDQPISKLFTPTLASRIQNLTGKKVYEPV